PRRQARRRRDRVRTDRSSRQSGWWACSVRVHGSGIRRQTGHQEVAHPAEGHQEENGGSSALRSPGSSTTPAGRLASLGHVPIADYAGAKNGMGGPPSVATNFTATSWPIFTVSRSQSTMLVIIVGPSAKVT